MLHKSTFKGRKGFTLIELLVVIAIISILAAILFPVFARARESARRASCLSNLKQIGLAITMYSQDYDEAYPQLYNYYNGAGNAPLVWWQDMTQPYIKNWQVFICPSDSTPNTWSSLRTGLTPFDIYSSYAMNGTAIRGAQSLARTSLASFENPSTTLIVMDSSNREIDLRFSDVTSAVTYVGPTRLADIHLDGDNFLFADGHAKWLKQTQESQWTLADD